VLHDDAYDVSEVPIEYAAKPLGPLRPGRCCAIGKGCGSNYVHEQQRAREFIRVRQYVLPVCRNLLAE
jgi:hypothetical protein